MLAGSVEKEDSELTLPPNEVMSCPTQEGQETQQYVVDSAQDNVLPHEKAPAGRPFSSVNFSKHFYDVGQHGARAQTLPVTKAHLSLHPHHDPEYSFTQNITFSKFSNEISS